MEILDITPSLYSTIIANPAQVFNSSAFSDLNASKCDKIHYIVFKDTKYRLGITLGVRNNILISPFSASFGGFEAVHSDVKLYQIDEAISKLVEWAKEYNYEGIKLISPPSFYNPNFDAKITNCLYRARFETKNIELNYHFETSNLDENYLNSIWYNARKNLKKALSFSLDFKKLNNDEGKRAYDVIAINRSERGFPLRLSYEQLQETDAVISIDYFLVEDDKSPVAAAIVYHLSDNVVRVVYWGDLPEFSDYKTMNFLSYKIFEYYKKIGISFIDIGHSTVESVPNNGLCEFKESIGCSLGLLYEYYKKID